MTCWKPGPPYGFISTGSLSAWAYGLDGLGAMIAVYNRCSPSRVNVTFGVNPGSAAVLVMSAAVMSVVLAASLVLAAMTASVTPPTARRVTMCRIRARAERISRPDTTMPRAPREAVH